MMFYVDTHTMSGLPDSVREQVLGWLRAHDLDPKNIVAAKVVGRQIHVSEYKLDQLGRPMVNRQHTEIKTRQYRVQLRQAPPELEAV